MCFRRHSYNMLFYALVGNRSTSLDHQTSLCNVKSMGSKLELGCHANSTNNYVIIGMLLNLPPFQIYHF